MSGFGAVLSDIGTTMSDCWNGRRTDGDLAAVALDSARAAGIDGAPEGASARTAINNAETSLMGPDHQGPGNTGNHIGTIAGSIVGGTIGAGLGPFGIAAGASEGSKIGGWISEHT
jgi:phage tail tape-measure protein